MQFGDPVMTDKSDAIRTQGGRLVGFYVNSGTGTLTLRDGREDGRVFAVTQPAKGYHPFPAALAKGLYAQIDGDLTITFLVN